MICNCQQLLVVAFLLAVGTADQELETDASVPPVQVYNLDEIHHGYHGHGHDHHHKHTRPYNVYLGDVHGHKGQSKVERIVTELYNPDYIEPIRLLDYRYLKTGGRDYTRGPGGQVLILPKHVRINQKKEFGNYDELLEFLRLKQLAEHEAYRSEMSHLGYDQRYHDYYEQRVEVGHHDRHHNDYRDHDNRHHDRHHQDHYRQGYSGYAGYGSKREADVPSQEAQPVVEAEKAAE